MLYDGRKPLGLYLHFPFCVRKCRYCDFLSFPADEAVRSDYVRHLIEEIRMKAADYSEYEIGTVFFGGGTPSLMTGEQMMQIMNAVRSAFHVSESAEITCECNPGTVDGDKLLAFRKAGINRISFGLQSMSDEELRYLGRIHKAGQFLENFAAARAAGFDNINIDLMSALPGQSVASYRETVERVLALNPEHISAYSLIIEEGTSFWDIYGEQDTDGFQYEKQEGKEKRDFLPLPDEDSEREMYHLTGKLLKENGYERYEISNYAREGRSCRHNMIYWTGGDYLGLGLGAASKVGSYRFTNTSDLSIYMKDPDCADKTVLTQEDQMEEMMFLGLRCMKGISTEAFEERFGRPIESVYGEVIRRYEQQGLLVLDREKKILALTERGIDVSNWVLSDFLL